MKTYYYATSISPWNNHPARAFVHLSEECPLLKHWQGQVSKHTRKVGSRRRCPFCSNKKMLAHLLKAYTTYLLYEEQAFYYYLLAYLEGHKTKKQLEKDIEDM